MEAESPRPSRLDLSDAEVQQLFGEVALLAAREMSALRERPVFEAPPDGAALRAALRADAPLPRRPVDRESLFEAVQLALSAGRRSSSTFFGYVLSPATAIAAAADLVASVADQNVRRGARLPLRPSSNARHSIG